MTLNESIVQNARVAGINKEFGSCFGFVEFDWGEDPHIYSMKEDGKVSVV